MPSFYLVILRIFLLFFLLNAKFDRQFLIFIPRI